MQSNNRPHGPSSQHCLTQVGIPRLYVRMRLHAHAVCIHFCKRTLCSTCTVLSSSSQAVLTPQHSLDVNDILEIGYTLIQYEVSLDSPWRIWSRGMLSEQPLEARTMLDHAKSIRQCCHCTALAWARLKKIRLTVA